MEFFIDNIVYIAVFVTIVTVVFLFFKKNKNGDIYIEPTNKLSFDEIEIKLRAYERLTLFLERIEPISMLNRLELHNVNIELLKSSLIKNIIIEYEYNLSQQIYVSDELWKVIELVKNKIINNISSVSDSLPLKATTNDFVEKMLNDSKKNNLIIQRAKKFLKQEVRHVS